MKDVLRGALVLVGTGKMGGAMLEGWLREGVPADMIIAIDPSPPEEVRSLIARHGIRHNPELVSITNAEVIVIAVKPQILENVLAPLAALNASSPLIVSVVAGKKIAVFERFFGSGAAIIRTIPNTPASIGRGITAMIGNARVSGGQRQLAMKLLAAVGEVVEVRHEDEIDAVTALSGSGPAYVFYLTECLAAAGERAGLDPSLAMKLARATVSGAGELLRASGLPAATLRQNVTSPNGTTFAALQVLMSDKGLLPLMTNAVAAATRRSRELAG
jgi:pyrroline-5-carboxylate reductase